MRNNLNRGNFKLLFDNKRIPTLEGIIGANIPGVSLSTFTVPLGNGIDMKKPGNDLTFQPLTVRFKVDKYLVNWEIFLNWMLELRGLKDGKLKDIPIGATLQICADNGLVYREIDYHRLIPSDLDEIEFMTDENDTDLSLSTVTFEFQYFELKPLDDKFTTC